MTALLSGRRLWALLILSLAANLFLGGLMLGRALAVRAPGPIRDLARTLPEPDRGAFTETLRAVRPEVDVHYGRVREEVAAVRAALTAEPFDPEALGEALERTRFEADKARLLAHRALVDAASRMSPAGRAVLAQSRLLQRRVEP